MASAGYLIAKRVKGGKELAPLQLRIFVPKGLQAIVGKKEIWRSLKTSDSRLAERRAVDAAAAIYSEWEALETAQAKRAAGMDLPGLAVDRAYDRMLDSLEERRRKVADDDGAYAAHLAERRSDLLKLTRRRQDGTQEHWEGIADRVLANEGLELPKDSEGYQSFVNAIADSTIDALSVFNRRNEGDLGAEPRSKVVREALDREADTAPAGETLSELFERYAAQRMAEKRKRQDTINQDRKVILQFAEFVGAKRSVRTITGVDVRDWIDTIAVLPPNYRKLKDYRGRAKRQHNNSQSNRKLPSSRHPCRGIVPSGN